ncbi:MAG: hypothetical protein PVJ27_07355 [Candidatus Brocadiaceae bacterium]|jgi:hypothetical protein
MSNPLVPFQSELFAFLLGLGVAAFILSNHRRLEQLPRWRVLLSAFYLLFTGWAASLAEHYCTPVFWNTVEHCCYAASSFSLAAWCWACLLRGRRYDVHRNS